MDSVWTMSEARKDFDELFFAAAEHPQIVTVRGTQKYIFSAARPAVAKKLKAQIVVTCRSINNGPKR